MDGFFVAADRITGRREPREFAPVLAIIAAKALPVIAGTYLGVATRSRDAVVERVATTSRAEDTGVRRTLGLMDQHLFAGRAMLDALLTEVGEDPEPSADTFRTATIAKRAIMESARTVGDLAMDVLGGRAYRRGDEVERAWRDLRAGPFHPLDAELTLRLAGDVALGRPPALR